MEAPAADCDSRLASTALLSSSGARRGPLRLEQLRRERGQIIAPVQPRVRAFALEEDRLEAVRLQQLHRVPRGGDQPVVFAGAEPEQAQTLFRRRVVERGEILPL